jgi:hypothetical protein
MATQLRSSRKFGGKPTIGKVGSSASIKYLDFDFCPAPGLPDGIFSSQTSFGMVWKDFELKLFIFYDHLVRVARWFVFKPKIPIWVNSGGPFSMKNVCIFYDHLK